MWYWKEQMEKISFRIWNCQATIEKDVDEWLGAVSQQQNNEQ
jgi:hypothetical protein